MAKSLMELGLLNKGLLTRAGFEAKKLEVDSTKSTNPDVAHKHALSSTFPNSTVRSTSPLLQVILFNTITS